MRIPPAPSFPPAQGDTLNGTLVYRCPGEEQPIERAVHLGRLAAYYPACARCPHRTDSGTLSSQRVERLEQLARQAGTAGSLFGPEGVSGVYRNEIDAAIARRLGQSLGMHLLLPLPSAEGTSEPPNVLLAGDGNPSSAELAAAAADGLRWAGCQVVDCGAATAPALLSARQRSAAAGAMLVGNPNGQPGRIGLTMWGRDGLPLSAGGELDAVQKIFEAKQFMGATAGLSSSGVCQHDAGAPLLHKPEVAPQSRIYAQTIAARLPGGFVTDSVEAEYLTGLADFYHALRPLRLVVETSSVVLRRYLESLLSRVAIELVVQNPASGDGEQRLQRISEHVRQNGAHLGIWIDGYGQSCRVVDERGAVVAPESLVSLLAREAVGLTGDAKGRIWFAGNPAAADALRVLTLLLVILSRSDLPLSRVIGSAIL